MNTGKSGTELRGSLMAGYDDGKLGGSLGTNVFRGLGGMSEFRQRTGIVNFRAGDFSASYENDGFPFPILGLSDGNDSYRTAAVRISYGEVAGGFNLFTGFRDKESYRAENRKYGYDKKPNVGKYPKNDKNATTGDFDEKYPHNFVVEKGKRYRAGIAYLSYGQTKIGIDSDLYIRHPIQDIGAHHYAKRQPGFKTLTNTINQFLETSDTDTFKSTSSPRFTLYD